MTSLPLKIYYGILRFSAPVLEHILKLRCERGKEISARLGERKGVADMARPSGKLLWLHGASVGESLSALLLVERLLEADENLHIMVTTGTVTSAELLENRLPKRAFHQFIPLDNPLWVKKFYDHWQPDMVLWMESEIWPHLLLEAKKRGIPVALLNARISPKSLDNWRKFPKTISEIMSVFSFCHAQADYEIGHLEALGANNIAALGNLKYAAAAPSCDEIELEALKKELAGRDILFYASTHKGEEILAAKTHERLKEKFPDLLTLIAPRHPQRGVGICAEFEKEGFEISCRSEGKGLNKKSDIYICDTLGEYGLFYRLADIAIIGGSFVPHGGQTPIEAAKLGCPIIYGEYMFNFVEICEELEKAEAALLVKGGGALGEAISDLLGNADSRGKMADNAKKVAMDNAAVIDRVMKHISPLLKEAGIKGVEI